MFQNKIYNGLKKSIFKKPLPLAKDGSYLFILAWPLTSLGGVSQVVDNLMNQMDRYGRYTPLLMVNSWEDRKIRALRIKGIIHHFFRLRNPFDSSRPLKNLIAFFVFFVSMLFNLLQFIKSNNVTVINVHYCGLYALNISIVKILRLFRGRFILSFHGKDLLMAQHTQGLEKRLWKLLLGSADTIVTCSESLRNDLIQFDSRCSDRIVAIHNGIDISCLEHERDRSYYLDKGFEKRKIVLNVATFEQIKGQDILLKAFAKIESLFPEVDLVIIGRPEEALRRLKNIVKDLGLAQRVWLYEGLPHSKIAAFYENATIFALPSRYESFGIVILEAGAFGLPVVASCVGGVQEILSHNETARLCEPENIECFSRELMYLLERPDERKRLGRNLKAHVMDNFSWDKAYKKYIECASD